MSKSRGRVMCSFAGILVAANLLPVSSWAQNYPVKPIRIVVGMAVGGALDLPARAIAKMLSERLGQQVIVENRTGAGGAIATEAVAKSTADGYTLLMLNLADTVLPSLRKLPYDLENDFAPVSFVSTYSDVIGIHPSVPARNIKELIAISRSQPGKLSYGSSGIGSLAHLSGELFNMMAKVSLIHVPYKGGAESALAAASGQVSLCIASVSAVLPLLHRDKLRPLAVTTATRASLLPSVPTIDESGVPGYDYFGWNGVSAPAGVPKDIIVRLNTVLNNALSTPEAKELLGRQGLDPRTSTPEQFRKFVNDSIVQNAKLIKLAGVKVE
jgi:tripartite-type tricarboxylate transporter receptor subunit TctC